MTAPMAGAFDRGPLTPPGEDGALRVALLGPPQRCRAVRHALAGWSVATRVVVETPYAAVAAQAVAEARAALLVVDLSVITDTSDLGWIRHVLIWPRMPRVLLLGGSPRDEAWLAALPTDLAAVLDRNAPIPVLLTALRAQALEPPRPARRPTTPDVGPPPRLTEREREIVDRVGRGLTTDEIATDLSLGRTTVTYYASRARQKLRVRSRAELARVAHTLPAQEGRPRPTDAAAS